ncbi:MAG: hypothetical protein ACFE9Q_06360 [Candidatus Hodarchaeota archaeon]
MSNRKINTSKIANFKNNKEKISFKVEKIVCFACGEKVNLNTEICPYCRTTIK